MTEDAPTVPDAVPGPSWVRRLLRMVGIFLVLLTVGVGTAVAALLYPYVRDDLRLDGIVRVVALDWRDFGPAKADERLRFEFDRQAIGPHTSPADCRLREAGEGREVACAWTVEIRAAGRTLPLTFHSRATLDADGELH